MELTLEQQEAINEIDKNLQIVACAGSGKTEVISRRIANILNCDSNEIYFTSGGTESDNWALKGIVEIYKGKHIITSKIEHNAILKTCQYLEKHGYEVDFIVTHCCSVSTQALIGHGRYSRDYLNTYLEEIRQECKFKKSADSGYHGKISVSGFYVQR